MLKLLVLNLSLQSGVRRKDTNGLKDMIKKYGNFRTFSYDKIITNQVFLEDVRLPRAFIRELAGEN